MIGKDLSEIAFPGVNPLVSVVMPALNAAPWIADAVTSILKQTYQHLELVVVDDGSADSTVKIVSNIDDPRIRLFQPGRLGFINALEFGIRQARGKWVARMDADDISHPYRLASQLEALNGQRDTVLCGTGFGYITPGGYVLQRKSFFDRRELTHGLITKREKMFADATLVFDRRSALDVGLYDDDLQHNELSLWYKLLKQGRGLELGKCAYFQRIHQGGMNIGQNRPAMDSIVVRKRYNPHNAGQFTNTVSQQASNRQLLKGIRRKLYICRAAGDYVGVGRLLIGIVQRNAISITARAAIYALTGRESIWVKTASAKKPKAECRRFVPENDQVVEFLNSFGLKIAQI